MSHREPKDTCSPSAIVGYGNRQTAKLTTELAAEDLAADRNGGGE